MTRPEVAIVGAGPYGLSLAAHLRARGIPRRILGPPMHAWRERMPDGMFLKSEGFASSLDDPDGSLTLRRFCSETGREYGEHGFPVPLQDFVAYGQWFQKASEADVEDVEVIHLAGSPEAFVLELASGEILRTPRVVVATGSTGFPHMPAELASLGPDRASHSSAHRSFAVFAGRTVAVVGGGQSALETAALLAEQGADARLVVRKPEVLWHGSPAAGRRPTGLPAPRAPLGRSWKFWLYHRFPAAFRLLPDSIRVPLALNSLGPAGAWWLRDRVEPRVPMLTGHRLVGAEETPRGVRLTLLEGDSRTELEVDHVIAGTGYRFDLDRLDLLDSALRTDVARVGTAPRLSAHFESSVPGLYFVGAAAANTFGPAMRFVCGTAVASPRVAGHIARRGIRRPADRGRRGTQARSIPSSSR